MLAHAPASSEPSPAGPTKQAHSRRRHSHRTDLQVPRGPVLDDRAFVVSDIVHAVTTEPKRPPDRPRKWDSEAERKRAYRARRAAELADPLAQRQAAKAAGAVSRSQGGRRRRHRRRGALAPTRRAGHRGRCASPTTIGPG